MQRLGWCVKLCVPAVLIVPFLFCGFGPADAHAAATPKAQSPESADSSDNDIIIVPTPCVKGCDDVCDSGKVNDECGVCGGSGEGECGCDLSIKKDQCGKCGGDNSSCADCLGDPNGLAKDYGCGCTNPPPDECGVCGGSGKGECGCNLDIKKDQCGVCGGSGPGECGCDLTVKRDQCGVCGGDNSSCADCMGVPNGAAVDYGCGCNNPPPGPCGCSACAAVDPTPTPAPAQNSCVWVAAWAPFGNQSDADLYADTCITQQGVACTSLDSMASRFNYTNQGQVPGCFANLCTLQYVGGWTAPVTQQSDTVKMWTQCGNGDDYYQAGIDVAAAELAAFIGAPPPSEAYPYEGAWWYMDDNCHYVQPSDDCQICGFAGVSWSPVSLIWDENTSLDQDMSVVSFSVDAAHPEAYTLWKASEQAPLLVYDPDKTGRVTSARQLFGNFTFGGQTTNVSNRSSEALRTAWSDGYRAMALLDADGNKKLSGAELEPLSLWFDANRNARVDAGELRPVVQEGITALYVSGVQSVPGSKDLTVAVGYERRVNGKLVSGRSVDWFAETFTSRQEAWHALKAVFQSRPGTDAGNADPFVRTSTGTAAEADGADSWPQHPGSFRPHGVSDHSKDISGYWMWKVDEKNGELHPGVLALEQSGDGRVRGFSVVEMLLDKNDRGLKSAAVALPAAGVIGRNKEGKLELTMRIADQESGGKALSVATLSEDGRTFSGTTTQTFSMGEGARQRSAKVVYSWTAFKAAIGR